MSEDADVGAVDHVGFEELEEASISILALKLAHILNVLEFAEDEDAVRITLPMHECQHSMAFLPTIFPSQPSRRLGQEAHSDEQQDCGNHLQAPRHAEGGGAFDERTAVGDVEHDHDAPGDGPLLGTDETATFGWGRKLGDVDGDLGGADTDAETIDEAADYQHADILGGADDDGTDDPFGRST